MNCPAFIIVPAVKLQFEVVLAPSGNQPCNINLRQMTSLKAHSPRPSSPRPSSPRPSSPRPSSPCPSPCLRPSPRLRIVVASSSRRGRPVIAFIFVVSLYFVMCTS